ncbi:MAG: VCBS repeat-containing protein [Oscillospiraceae bacterium]|nr:VCBS repeat-containing protein [Oscillospiraceae bacterium]
MKNFIKKLLFICVGAVFFAVLTGCMTTSADELYSLPESSERYVQIQSKVDQLLSSGLEYAAPTAGTNRQAIQLQDIDGDGIEEALVFFRTEEDDKKPLSIHILKDSGETFEVAAAIEGDGTSIDSVTYIDMNGDGVLEIVVGWQMTASVKNLAVYSVKDYQPVQLVFSSYSNYTIADMDSDGDTEVLLLHTGTSETAGDVTMYMVMDDGEVISSTAYLSAMAERTSRVQTGLLADKKKAVFVDSASDEGVLTDIIAFLDGSLVNITIDGETMNSDTFRGYSVYCSDINFDGIIEVPEPVQFMPQSETLYYAINWKACSGSGDSEVAVTTYHNYSDGWYLILPEQSIENITIRREDRVSGERAVVFSIITGETDADGNPVLHDFMEIYALSGDNKEDRAKLSGRFTVARNDEQIFAVWIMSGGEQYMTRDYVNENFKLIHTTWLTGTV